MSNKNTIVCGNKMENFRYLALKRFRLRLLLEPPRVSFSFWFSFTNQIKEKDQFKRGANVGFWSWTWSFDSNMKWPLSNKKCRLLQIHQQKCWKKLHFCYNFTSIFLQFIATKVLTHNSHLLEVKSPIQAIKLNEMFI